MKKLFQIIFIVLGASMNWFASNIAPSLDFYERYKTLSDKKLLDFVNDKYSIRFHIFLSCSLYFTVTSILLRILIT